ncbi:MAG: hypothetical protein WB297_05285 [Actinomycetota bacterium]
MTGALAGAVEPPTREGGGAAVARMFPLPPFRHPPRESSWVVGAMHRKGVE